MAALSGWAGRNEATAPLDLSRGPVVQEVGSAGEAGAARSGYRPPVASDLRRDPFGSFWLYLDRPPYRIRSYDASFVYRFGIEFSRRVLAHDTDADGNLYVLCEGNRVSRHAPDGRLLAAWRLPEGCQPGEFARASAMAVDTLGRCVYLADADLHRVQRFSLDMQLRPFPFTIWGWIGREDLSYVHLGAYRPETSYYRLDRPQGLAVDPTQRVLYVVNQHFISKFDLGTGKQEPFGRFPALGWGGSFSDSARSESAALDGHFQDIWLSGVDQHGNLYVSDAYNPHLSNGRIQKFSPRGELLGKWDANSALVDDKGQPVRLGPVRAIAFGPQGQAWLTDLSGRIYEGPGLASGGRIVAESEQ